jgi:hypothetical protein
MYLYLNIEVRSRNHFCCEKIKYYIFLVFVCVALVIQHAMRMRGVVFSSVACPDLQYFPTLSHKRHDFRKKSLLNT